MSWFLLPDEMVRAAAYAPRAVSPHRPISPRRLRFPAEYATHVPRAASAALGSVSAAHGWTWSTEEQPTPRIASAPKAVRSAAAPSSVLTERQVALRIPAQMLHRMSTAARVTGRSESDIWLEAAQEWLSRYVADDEPPPPTPAAAALAVPRPVRSWGAIDALLADLRAYAAPTPEPALPAA